MKVRPLLESDLPSVIGIRNHPETIKYLHTPKLFTLSEAMIWFAKEKPTWFAIEDDHNVMLGYVRTSEWDFKTKSLYIGCDIDPCFRRKGFASLAYKLILNRLKRSGWNIVKLLVLKSNTIAFQLYQGLGFKTKSETEDSFYMEYQLNNTINTGKAVKVVATYFGKRRAPPRDAKDNLNMLKFLWQQEQTLDQGVPYDTIIINNELTDRDAKNDPEDMKKCEDFINEINGAPTKNGKAIVLRRGNMGLSFGAFDYIFNMFSDQYDYWYFSEDDQILIKENVYINALKQLYMPTEKPNGFIATVGVNREIDLVYEHGRVKAATRRRRSTKVNIGPAAYGGCGITTREVLNQVRAANYSDILNRGHLPYNYILDNNAAIHIIDGEIRFTRAIHDLAYHLDEYNGDNIAICWGSEYKRTKLVLPFSKG